MFTLLVGCPPFWHRKQMVMLRNIMEGKYSFTSPEWAEISGEKTNLIWNRRECDWFPTFQRIQRIWFESAWLWMWRNESRQRRLSSIHSLTRWWVRDGWDCVLCGAHYLKIKITYMTHTALLHTYILEKTQLLFCCTVKELLLSTISLNLHIVLVDCFKEQGDLMEVWGILVSRFFPYVKI